MQSIINSLLLIVIALIILLVALIILQLLVLSIMLHAPQKSGLRSQEHCLLGNYLGVERSRAEPWRATRDLLSRLVNSPLEQITRSAPWFCPRSVPLVIALVRSSRAERLSCLLERLLGNPPGGRAPTIHSTAWYSVPG
jgi:hypothetical protein